MPPELIREPAEIQQRMAALKRQGRAICLVPTMGALHKGHRALIHEGRRQTDVLIVSIFVNPTQFAPNEDLSRYPRTFESDLKMCEDEKCDFVFLPSSETMYAPGFSTWVQVENLGVELCGRSRPAHFRGVTTVCAKLFLLTQADKAVFGWKDAQQQLIIRRMVRDLNIPIEIVGVETVREEDGLAMSSRNAYLAPEERAEAPVLYRALQAVRKRIHEENETDSAVIRLRIAIQIEKESRAHIDYVEVVSLDKVEPIRTIEPGNTLIAVAAWWGSTRLIDNIRL
jgi:pantoate--beta-alanine ligase